MAKIKVGDKVRVPREAGTMNKCASKHAEYLIITHTDKSSGEGKYAWEAFDATGERIDWCFGHHLEESDFIPYEESSQSRFKIGDVVSANNPGSNRLGVVYGKVIFSKENSILVEFVENIRGHSGDDSDARGEEGHCWYCHPGELTLITPGHEKSTYKFKVGDRVRVKRFTEKERKALSNPCWNSQMDGFMGNTYTISRTNAGFQGNYINFREDRGSWSWLPDWLELVSEKSPYKFKLGDRVRGGYDDVRYTGKVIEITEEKVYVDRDDHASSSWACKIRPDGSVAGANNFDDGVTNLELVEESKPTMAPPQDCPCSGTDAHPTSPVWRSTIADWGASFDSSVYYKPFIDALESRKPAKSIMSKITTYVKNLTLSADEKLLRKYYLHDECGETTDAGKDAILAKFFASKENQDYLVEIAKGLDAEAKEDKK